MVNNASCSAARTNTIAWLAVGTMIGSLAALLVLEKRKNRNQNSKEQRKHQGCRGSFCGCLEEKRKRLPELVILLRHGESEANADNTLWRTKPDNQINLTDTGIQQSKEAGRRIEALFEAYEQETSKHINRVQIQVSPFERTLQTTAAAIPYFEHRVVQTLPESRIREQEAGNFPKRDVDSFREEQLKVGRFWYRFPTGESGADVYDRVKSWWHESILATNERLYNWSPTTFHSVWSSGVCDMYVLRKDFSRRGTSPYVLDSNFGDMPRSSMDLCLRFKTDHKANDSETTGASNNFVADEKIYRLHDYLDVPPPRMRHIDIIKQKLAEEYPELDIDTIDTISFRHGGTEIEEEPAF